MDIIDTKRWKIFLEMIGSSKSPSKCFARILDSIFVDHNNLSWYFTTKNGSVSKKKDGSYSLENLLERFSKFSLANPSNTSAFVAVVIFKGTNTTVTAEQLRSSYQDILNPHLHSFQDTAIQIYLRPKNGVEVLHSALFVWKEHENFGGVNYFIRHKGGLDENMLQFLKINQQHLQQQILNSLKEIFYYLQTIKKTRISKILIHFIVDDNDQIWLHHVSSFSAEPMNVETNNVVKDTFFDEFVVEIDQKLSITADLEQEGFRFLPFHKLTHTYSQTVLQSSKGDEENIGLTNSSTGSNITSTQSLTSPENSNVFLPVTSVVQNQMASFEPSVQSSKIASNSKTVSSGARVQSADTQILHREGNFFKSSKASEELPGLNVFVVSNLSPGGNACSWEIDMRLYSSVNVHSRGARRGRGNSPVFEEAGTVGAPDDHVLAELKHKRSGVRVALSKGNTAFNMLQDREVIDMLLGNPAGVSTRESTSKSSTVLAEEWTEQSLKACWLRAHERVEKVVSASSTRSSAEVTVCGNADVIIKKMESIITYLKNERERGGRSDIESGNTAVLSGASEGMGGQVRSGHESTVEFDGSEDDVREEEETSGGDRRPRSDPSANAHTR